VVSRFLHDANIFVASSHEAIKRSIPHIYISALPFADKQSLVYQDFAPHSTGHIGVDMFGIYHHSSSSTVKVLAGHSGAVRSVAYSHDGRLLASGSTDGTARVWDTRTSTEILPSLHGGSGWVLSVDLSPDKESVALGTEAGVVWIWSIVPGQESNQPLRGHSSQVNSVRFSSDGLHLASASNDETVRLWNAETGILLAVLRGHTGCVNGVAFSPDGAILASASSDGTIRLWRSPTGEAKGEPLRGSGCDGVDFSPDGEMIAGVLLGTFVLLQRNGERRAGLEGATRIHSVRFSPDGRSLVAAHGQGVRLWKLQPGKGDVSPVDISGHSGEIHWATVSPGGWYIASASEDGMIRIGSAISNQPLIQPLIAHVLAVNSVAVSHDGAFIISGSDDMVVGVWDARTGEPTLPPLKGPTDWVVSVAICPDGSLIASGSGDGTVWLWDAESGAAAGEPIRGHIGEVKAVTFSRDGRWLASVGDVSVLIWDLETDQAAAIRHFRGEDALWAVSFSPDNALVVAGDQRGRIYLWRLDTGEQVQEPLHIIQKCVWSIAFSPDSTFLVFAGNDDAVHISDVPTDRPILTLRGHTDSVRSVAWSPDGSFVGTGSYDHTVRIWNPSNGLLLATLHGHADQVTSVAFIPDGKSIVSGSADSTIRKWDLSAVFKSASEDIGSPVSRLAFAAFKEGWLVGSSGELLLWVPAEYRRYIQPTFCTLQISRSRVVIKAGDRELHPDVDWTLCWRD